MICSRGDGAVPPGPPGLLPYAAAGGDGRSWMPWRWFHPAAVMLFSPVGEFQFIVGASSSLSLQAHPRIDWIPGRPAISNYLPLLGLPG
jgi:hypothetical protein